MLNGIKHFLEFVSDNWTTMFIIIALITVAYVKINAFLKQSDDQKIAAAKAQIKESMLKLVGDAEADYQTWKMAGSLKRSMVIQRIFADYPVLSKIIDQDALVSWIDEQIDNALKELRKIIANNKAE